MNNQKDIEIMQAFIRTRREEHRAKETPGAVCLRAGRHFLGAPYAAKTLEVSGPEALVIDLGAFDCFTLVESCCALAVMLSTGKEAFTDYADILRTIRYRNGLIAGYPSRLHYFVDWLLNSEEGEVLMDITPALGGIPFRKVLNFMTTHSGLYPPLHDPANCREMIAIEKRLSRVTRHFLPKGELRGCEGGISDGDIIAITTDQEGLDVSHMGIAARRDGELHLLHASEQAGKVVISPQPLVDYLHLSSHRTGIMAARLVVAC
jgi:hypothetical protein